IELNSDLGAGGTTPSFGLIKQTVEYAHHRHVPVVVMIRPRGGDFVYSDGEIAVMESDLQAASLLGADAVAFGCLTAAGQLDKRLMKRLLGLSQVLGLQAVMHMAFDAILPEDQHAALDWLSAHGVKRVLTHGGNLDQTIFATLVHLKTLVEWAGTRIE
ncbi:copper homeostasis protein CutC, partial [Lactobacillus sp. XV13L]|nr:copper homeostasis protein CutC [Lactobacillus sp. XV13L]